MPQGSEPHPAMYCGPGTRGSLKAWQPEGLGTAGLQPVPVQPASVGRGKRGTGLAGS